MQSPSDRQFSGTRGRDPVAMMIRSASISCWPADPVGAKQRGMCHHQPVAGQARVVSAIAPGKTVPQHTDMPHDSGNIGTQAVTAAYAYRSKT